VPFLKKLLPILFLTFFFLFLPPPLLAQNKFGLNVSGRPNHIDRGAADYIGQNGWIVMMPNAQNYNAETANAVYDEIVGGYFSKMGGRVNYILRAHEPHSSSPQLNDHPTFPDKTDPQWAEKWADFWAGIINRLPIPQGSALYVMPWNEPNLSRECSGIGNPNDPLDYACAPYVQEYLNKLAAKINRNKVKLLTPMFANSATNFHSFVQYLGGANFLNRFDGLALAYYDFEAGCDQPFCNPDPRLNPDKYHELLENLGIPNQKLFILETGLVSPGACGPGVPDCPNFQQPAVTKMLCELYNRHKTDPQLIMFSPLTYNPETKGTGSWFWDTNATRDFYSRRYSDCSLIKENGSFLEEISLQNDSFCTNFNINYQATQEDTVASSSSIPAKQSQNISGVLEGDLRWDKRKFLDFAKMEQTTGFALARLLPEKLRQTLVIDDTPLKTKAQHFVRGETIEKTPETNTILPTWWTRLLGETKILCGLFGTCPPPQSMAIKIKEPASLNIVEQSKCQTGETSNTSSEQIFVSEQPKFKAKSLITRIIEFFSRIASLLKRTTNQATLTNKTRGVLVGGKTLNRHANFWDSFIPQEKTAGKKNGPLTTDATFSLSNNYSAQEGANRISYQNQKATQYRYCLSLCSQYPQNIDIKTIDPLCPSCDPDDYPLSLSYADDIPLDMSLCQRGPDGACHYYDPSATQGCGPNQDPVCEGGKCNPYEYGQAKDYLDNGCSIPYGNIASDCSSPQVCRKAKFPKNPKGGYGACQYTHETVCVRTDRASTGSCAAVCNWACCAYQ